MDLSGIFPPVTTPFNEDETIAYDRLEENMKRWNSVPLKGYLVQGSNGEYKFLSDEERVEMVRRVKKAAASGKLVIAGSGCESTQATIQMTQKMADAGAHAVLVVTPLYYKASMTNDAMTSHFSKVADSSPVPVILYNVPWNSGIDLSPDVVVKLASHPNIIGLKESGGDVSKIAWMAYRTRNVDFQYLAGSAGFMLPGYSVGCVGSMSALATVLPEEVCKLDQLFRQGDMKGAMLLQQKLVGPNAAVTKMFGVAGLKSAMDDLGYFGGPTRLPILPLTPSQRTQLRQIFTDSGYMSF